MVFEKPFFYSLLQVFPKLNYLVENLNENRKQILLLVEEDTKNKEKKN